MTAPLDDLTHSLTDTLSEKEKETLRLIVRGHDAKTAASELGLSVHTINERLRAARRKLDVTSSREAARKLLESEAEAFETTPEVLVYEPLGDASAPPASNELPITAFRSNGALWTGGIIAMSLLALTLALALAIPSPDATSVDVSSATAKTTDSVVFDDLEVTARDWLKLVDASDWQASYDAAGRQFREPNTVAGWQAASQQARVPLGDVLSREVVEVEEVNAPPRGYSVVKFRTRFTNRTEAFEIVTLEREGGAYRVVGFFIE